MAIIYKIQNKQNDKIYIGQTKRTLEWRLNNGWCGHFPAAFEKDSNGYLHRALRKHGKDAFTYEVIEERDNTSFDKTEDVRAWLNEREIYWIDFYKSNRHEFGYNKTSGGSSDHRLANHDYHSERMTEYNNKCWADAEFRKKRSEQVSKQAKRMWNNPEHRVKVISKMRETNSSRTQEEKHMIAMKQVEGRRLNGTLHQSESTKEKLRLAAIGNTNVKGRIYVYKEGKSRMIKVEELESFLSDGWLRGRGKVQWS